MAEGLLDMMVERTEGQTDMGLVTVDFDGTLFKGNSFKVMFQVAKADFSIKEWSVVGLGLLKAGAKGLTGGKEAFKHGFFKAFARSFKGKTEGELTDFFNQLVVVGKPNVNHELVSRVREHQNNGDTVIVLSGALRPFLYAFIESLQLDVHVIGTELQVNSDGVCTGEIGEIVNGQVKVDKVQQWLKENHPAQQGDVQDTWAYADSLSDVELLEFVKHPIVVNPSDDMVKMAQEKNWPIFSQPDQAANSL
ncbi:Phosphoserine phosphatase [Lentibacillus sp. JNUCC-1]|uniref:HAD family hydrolase n=1 Tax=Lentibacillus sp. JNUCC-1 TaxID=2654513 RepID=UPI0013221A83|nr:HAD family hydrolase [Lentibacillus sp. JNUCC-1]MUV38961.1 Phosphoserine phosphatase [Lentibacillus sp. JNUCC-1]